MEDPVFDVCIVGAGLFGSAAARHSSMSGRNRKVCLIGQSEPNEEGRHSREIFSSHYDAGRGVRKYQGTNSFRSILSRHSFMRFTELQESTGIQFYYETGYLFYGYDVKDKMDSMATNQQDGIYLTTNQIADRYSFLDITPHGNGAMFIPRDAGYINPRRFIAAQLRAAERQGCDVIDAVVQSVDEVKVDGKSDPLLQLQTECGRTYLSKKVLLCTGAFANFKDVIPGPLKLDLQVEGEYALKLEVGERDLERIGSMPSMASVYDPLNSCYILPPIKYPDGKTYIKIGKVGKYDNCRLNTLRELKEWYLSPPETNVMDRYYNILTSIVKDFKPKSAQIFKCLCANTPNGLPYCDMISPRLGIVTGGNGLGANIADEIGRMGADMVDGVDGWSGDIRPEQLQAKYAIKH